MITLGRRLTSVLVLCLLFSPILFWPSGTGLSRPQTRGSGGESDPVDVSMVALLADPQRYDNKLVRVHGFLCVEFEGNALYLHEEDFKFGLTKNALALRFSDSQVKLFKGLSRRYVILEGVVHAQGYESSDLWTGSIGEMTRLEAWPFNRGPLRP
jgi:hypothetical protein